MSKKSKYKLSEVGLRNANPQIKPLKPNGALQALTSAALVLPGLLFTSAEAADPSLNSFSFQQSRFQEGKRNLFNVPNDLSPIQADVLQAMGSLSLTDRVTLSFGYTRDVWSGATPVTSSPLVAKGNNPVLRNAPGGGTFVSGASPIVNRSITLDRDLNPIGQDGQVDTRSVEVLSFASPEVRNSADFGLGYEWNEAALRVGGGISRERDFNSGYGNVSGRLDFNQKLTSAKFGFGYTSSSISAIIDHDIDNYLTKTAFEDQIELSDDLRTLRGRRQDWAANIGFSQVLSKSSLIDVNVGYTHSSGFMENPYKAVQVIFVNPEFLLSNQDTTRGNMQAFLEQRPDVRNQVAISAKYIQHINPLDAAAHLDYKFSTDDWGINTNTFTLDWIQPLGNGWIVTPRVRYHSQDAADFYQTHLISEQNFSPSALDELDFEKLPDNFSSDHRLSGYGTLSGGVTLNKQITKGLVLRAGFEYFTRQSALQIGGNNEGSFGDFDFYVASAGLSINVEKFDFPNVGGSSRGSSSSDHSKHDGHKQHHGHGGHLPAGVMSGMMLDKAGEFMVGYRFMHGRMGGDLLHGASTANDLDIVNQGCGDGQCRLAPDFMNMNMHMLNVMYAPTNWLNLMVMPRFVDNKMNLRDLAGAPPISIGEHEHSGTPHVTGGVGDTTISSLIKLYNAPGHRLHLGLGISAPTGSVSEEFRRVFRIDGGLVHFGMQLGSGTWDFAPSLTYTGDHKRLTWGAQLSGTKRLENENKSGYRLGDAIQATTWGGYNLTRWLSASVRGVYAKQGAIHGDFNAFNARSGTMDFPANQGGQYWDIGFGINVNVPSGKFAGHNVSVEWLEPIRTDVNGFQLDRQGRLAAAWNYHF